MKKKEFVCRVGFLKNRNEWLSERYGVWVCGVELYFSDEIVVEMNVFGWEGDEMKDWDRGRMEGKEGDVEKVFWWRLLDGIIKGK